jgi:hypothetical protein
VTSTAALVALFGAYVVGVGLLREALKATAAGSPSAAVGVEGTGRS